MSPRMCVSQVHFSKFIYGICIVLNSNFGELLANNAIKAD